MGDFGIDRHLLDGLFGGFFQPAETCIEVSVQKEGHVYRFVGVVKQLFGGFAEAITLVVRQIPTDGQQVGDGIDCRQHYR